MVVIAALAMASCLAFVGRAETLDQPTPEIEIQSYTQAELDVMLGPIALYPDPLIAVLLPATTQPSEIVLAARFWDRVADANQIESQRWSNSVKALAYYPEVVRWLDENLEWSRQVGETFLNQPEDVMATIQRLRAMAQSFGNLQTTPQQLVEVNDGEIDILPADPEVVYVPVYEPAPIYTQTGGHIWFVNALRTGGWWKHDWDWQNKRIVVWTNDSPRPHNWWRQSRADRWKTQMNVQEWSPRTRAGQFPCKFWANRWQQNSKGTSRSQTTRPAASPTHSTTVTRISAR
jgi:hypothetical protein